MLGNEPTKNNDFSSIPEEIQLLRQQNEKNQSASSYFTYKRKNAENLQKKKKNVEKSKFYRRSKESHSMFERGSRWAEVEQWAEKESQKEGKEPRYSFYVILFQLSIINFISLVQS